MSLRLVTALFWLCILSVTCAAWLVAPIPSPSICGAVLRPFSLACLSGIALVLCGFVVTEGWLSHRRRHRLIWAEPSALAVPPMRWSLFAWSCQAIGLLLLLLIALHLCAPMGMSSGGGRGSSFVLAAVAFSSSASLFALVSRSWSAGIADTAAVLLTLGVCAAALCFVPGRSVESPALLPMRLNVMLTALAVLVAYWAWIRSVWTQQLAGGEGWTTAGRLHALVPRYALGAGQLGVVLSLLMSLWPALPNVTDSDASPGRIAFGLSGNLLLIAGLLLCGLSWRRAPFAAAAGLVAMSSLAFVLVRTVGLVDATG